MNQAAIASDRLEIAIYSQEIATDIGEIATNRPEIGKKCEEIRPNILETTARRLAMALNPRFTGDSL